jgi:L-ascorbate metabolism protein UlaG (beta-lactamase superfamily)
VLLELGGVRLLTDPVLRRRVAHLRRYGPVPEPPTAVDAVLISHLHQDHLDLPSLRRLADQPQVIAPRGSGGFLRRAGFEAKELAPGDSTEVTGLTVTAVRAVHDPRRWPFAGPRAEPLGFVLGGARSVYFAGDTDLFGGMADLGPVGVALLPVAGWGPKLGQGHLHPEGAARAAALLRAHLAVPIHWGTLYPITARRGAWFSEPPHEFAAQMAALAPGVAVRVLAPGESAPMPA